MKRRNFLKASSAIVPASVIPFSIIRKDGIWAKDFLDNTVYPNENLYYLCGSYGRKLADKLSEGKIYKNHILYYLIDHYNPLIVKDYYTFSELEYHTTIWKNNLSKISKLQQFSKPETPFWFIKTFYYWRNGEYGKQENEAYCLSYSGDW